MILVDTNVISEMMRQRPDPHVVGWFNSQDAGDLWTTAIVTMEIGYGLAIMSDGRRRTLMESAYEQLLMKLFADRIIAFDHGAARLTALRLAHCRNAGMAFDYRDCMIAAVAQAHGARLATRNTRHFEGAGIDLVNPFEHGQNL